MLADGLEKCGLPGGILSDRGKQFRAHESLNGPQTTYQMVLDLLGIRAVYARPYRPQTKGKIEKSFQFVQRDFLSEARFKVNSLNELNEAFAEWVRWYNHEHSHASLRGKPPAALYRTSERDSPLQIRSLCSVCHRRKVTREAIVRYRNRKCKVPAHLIGDHVWLRVTEDEFVVESQGFNVARHPLGDGHQAATAWPRPGAPRPTPGQPQQQHHL
ncbi:MAG TPA: integrase core domain-containing protein [Armatimonadota bacterium]|nr:integrase core domain-containing protein [Armatimonadota bacterium]